MQGVFALAAAATVAVLWLRDAPANIRNAALLIGTCVATPYLQDYDLVFGVLVAVWLVEAAGDDPQASRAAFYAAALLLVGPMVNALLGKWTGLSFGPLFILPAFAVVTGCAFRVGLPQAARSTA